MTRCGDRDAKQPQLVRKFFVAVYMLSDLATQRETPTPELTPKALAALEGYTFPGNVRELRNVIVRAFIVSEGTTIQPEHLDFHFPHVETFSALRTEVSTASPLSVPVETMFDEQERIRRALAAKPPNNWE